MRNIIILWIVINALMPFASGQRKVPTASRDNPHSLVRSLLREADSDSRNLVPEERADFLLDAAEETSATDPNLSRKFSLELFRLATSQLQLGSFRAATQKNALVILSRTDPIRAAELYCAQDTPEMWNEAVLQEDYRAFGARTLFSALYSRLGMSSIPTIRSISTWIASTGEYPYNATGQIILQLSPQDSETASVLATDAIRSFSLDHHFLDQYREFTEFNLSIHQRIPEALLRVALELNLEALDQEAEEAKDTKTPPYVIEMHAKQSIA
jgi:hypothetical protein